MNKKKYSNPKITINKVYTKSGDAGFTFLIGGKKVSKNSLRINVFGDIDELNCCIGNCIVNIDGIEKFKKLSSVFIFLMLIIISSVILDLNSQDLVKLFS